MDLKIAASKSSTPILGIIPGGSDFLGPSLVLLMRNTRVKESQLDHRSNQPSLVVQLLRSEVFLPRPLDAKTWRRDAEHAKSYKDKGMAGNHEVVQPKGKTYCGWTKSCIS